MQACLDGEEFERLGLNSEQLTTCKKMIMEYQEKLSLIAAKLDKLKIIKSFDSIDEPESHVLAYSFLEIEESCKRLCRDFFPKLCSDTLSEEDINNLLFDIGEEFRHIMYHIGDTKFYKYLNEE